MILIGETHIPGGHGSCRGLEGDFYLLFFWDEKISVSFFDANQIVDDGEDYGIIFAGDHQEVN